MTATKLVESLKSAGQDFEFYPTTKEMVQTIWNHRRKSCCSGSRFYIDGFGSVLDIGCGTCNFKKWIDELNQPFEKVYENNGAKYIERQNCVTISRYYVMEKSQILLDRLDASTICLGTDFYENTLIDKPVDTIFCNPPYSEYEEWTVRIIKESVCESIYLIIPQRWKESERIKLALRDVKILPDSLRKKDSEKEIEVIGSFDFLNAERSARAKVDILYISKEYTSKTAGFDHFFDEIFGMPEPEQKFNYESEEMREKQKNLENELTAGRNKVEILCNGYNDARNTLFNHFKVITSLDTDILKTIGIKKENVKEALKKQINGLKNLYWDEAFNCLDEITDRLTSKSREDIKNRFAILRSVDFTASNLYSLILWVIKNSNLYYTSQMVDFFKALSSPENVRNYKSNIRAFKRDKWGNYERKYDHYTLDYRIVCTQYALSGGKSYCYGDRGIQSVFRDKISDICTIANNLGFHSSMIDLPTAYGDKGDVLLADNTVLFTFRPYRNGNVHIKFNIEFVKALNVVVSRELGWIHCKEDIAKEFPSEMAAGAEKYFDRMLHLDLRNVSMLATPEPVMEISSCCSEPSEPEPLATPALNLFNWKKEA